MYYDDAQVQRENEQQIKKEEENFQIRTLRKRRLKRSLKAMQYTNSTWLHFK